ncbi:MAG TPA: hypothetical protein QF870_10750 [Nitrospinota bacterium]|nr:hypothetical protein [Nitrospinota bacterium]
MRRFLIAVLILGLSLSGGLAGCGKKGSPETPKKPIFPAIR